MKTRMNFKDEFYQKLKLLVLPIAIQNFMLALVSATDAIMLGWIDQTSLSAVSLAGQVQFVLSLFISGIAAGAGIMAAQYWGKQDAASIEKVIPIALRTNLLFSGLFTILAGFCPEMLMRALQMMRPWLQAEASIYALLHSPTYSAVSRRSI